MKKYFIIFVIILFSSIICLWYLIYLNNTKIDYIPTTISILSIIITGLLWFNFNKKFDEFKKTSDKKFQSYSELINLAKSFTNDPSLTYEDSIQMQKKFIEKYNNEILPFWPKNVVETVQKFLFNSWTNFVKAEENLQTKALFDIVQEIRKDLWLEKLNQENIEFHAINVNNLKDKLSKELPKVKDNS